MNALTPLIQARQAWQSRHPAAAMPTLSESWLGSEIAQGRPQLDNLSSARQLLPTEPAQTPAPGVSR